jgi:hypothetical protein
MMESEWWNGSIIVNREVHLRISAWIHAKDEEELMFRVGFSILLSTMAVIVTSNQNHRSGASDLFGESETFSTHSPEMLRTQESRFPQLAWHHSPRFSHERELSL